MVGAGLLMTLYHGHHVVSSGPAKILRVLQGQAGGDPAARRGVLHVVRVAGRDPARPLHAFVLAPDAVAGAGVGAHVLHPSGPTPSSQVVNVTRFGIDTCWAV